MSTTTAGRADRPDRPLAGRLLPVVLRVVRTSAAVVLGLVVLALVATLLLPRLAGWQPLVVTSGSMAPAIEPGAVVLVQPVPGAAVAEDDVITFRDPSGGLTTHRVAAVLQQDGGTVLRTRGDANEEADPTSLDPQAVVGRARFVVPRVGYLLEEVSTPLGVGALALLLALSLVPGGRRRPDEVVTRRTADPVAA